jgi:hypothetical protein
MNAGLHRIAVAVPTIFFLLWNPQLFRGQSEIPRRTYALFVGAILLNVVWFLGGWKFGLQYQGTRFTYSVCAINAVWILFLAVFLVRARKGSRSFANSLASHWLLFAWLAWYAFPYLGELP